jgi:hypothetical protein
LIINNLHRQPTALENDRHRALKLKVPITDWSIAQDLNAIFVAAVEFGDVCKEFPIVFVRVGKEPDGSDQIAPLAVLGLKQNQNLFLTGGRWRAAYMPAVLRFYPFCIGRIDDQQYAICVDMAFDGANEAEGQALFQADGQPAALLEDMKKTLGTLDAEIQRTRAVGSRLNQLGLLTEMRFDATLPDGSQHTVDGFLTVDEKKVQDLPDNLVLELHRNGLLALVQMHWVSMGNMRRLVDWHVERDAAQAPAPAAMPQPAAVQ